jgi:2-polyprenyl-3-methyl-5-hydroxy-6-metoxy-1,4-benzoquinol methylase
MRQHENAVRRGCEVCGSTIRHVAYEQRFVTFDHDAGLLAGYDVAVCDVCGFAYADGIPETLVFERYYRDMSKHEPSCDGSRPTPSYRKHNIDLIASYVVKHLPERTARILDVGVGTGDILLALRDLGYQNVTGLDPSPRTSEIVNRRHKLRVLNTPVSELRSCTERFDVILLSGVLEHLRDLRSTLSLLKALLGEGGSMCIAVPDAARFADCDESPYQYFSVEHINFFTTRSLESLLASVGMALESRCDESTALLGAFREPIIQGTFKASTSRLPLLRDSSGGDQISRYVAYSGRRQDDLMSRIRGLLDSGEGIIVWGTGSLTMHLLSDRRFSLLNIVAFVDANANYWDKTIRGIPVISPATVSSRQETILIVSYSYEDEIFLEIRDQYRLNNKVMRLFGDIH